MSTAPSRSRLRSRGVGALFSSLGVNGPPVMERSVLVERKRERTAAYGNREAVLARKAGDQVSSRYLSRHAVEQNQRVRSPSLQLTAVASLT